MAKKEKNIVDEIPENVIDNETPENPTEIEKDFPKFRTGIRIKLAKGFEERIDNMFRMIDAFNGEKYVSMLLQLVPHFLPKQSEERLDFDNEIPTLKMIVVKTLHQDETNEEN